ncbi:methionine--tRNA ligase [Candidatus Kaiserbacteria bacterium]|nr:methionine--tRNA ligase [Candidatus Kaiserbacteria bacterium]
MKKFYITTPIFYPNANLHLGHAYTTTVSDILARYHRLMGEKTHFLTGSDENTQKMVDAARKTGTDPMMFLDDIVKNFSVLYKRLNISYDQFIRTSDQVIHWPGAQLMWEKLSETGDIYEKEYEGLYCVGHEAFITEKDLVDGKCPDHGAIPERIREKNYFFRLSKYTEQIARKIETDELLIVPKTRKQEILSFLKQGLDDVSFSRPRRADMPQQLGIPVPGDESQTVYVWCDALANYITALGYGRGDGQMEFWPADVHVIGKDILRFHAAIWPGMLLSAGLPLPKSLLVHGFITSGGKKMSKTLGNVIDPVELLDEYGTDPVRYFLARHISTFEDGDITHEGFLEAYNANLANGLGNFAARVMTLSEKYIENIEEHIGFFSLPELKNTVVSDATQKYFKALDAYDFNAAADAIWEEIAAGDARMQKVKPFELVKLDIDKAVEELSKNFVQRLWRIAVMLEPIMPETALKLKEAIKSNKKPDNLFPRKE